MEVTDQIAAIKSGSICFASAGVRQVIGGYVVSGQMQYVDKATKGVVLSENAEGVASDAATAVSMIGNFLTSGTFYTEQPAFI